MELNKRAPEINLDKMKSREIGAIVDKMCESLNSMEDRLFLCGPEIGIDYRVVAVKFKEETDVFFNPAITRKDKMIIFRERSVIDGKEYFIPRFSDLTIAFQDYKGQVRSFKLNEVLSCVFGQALDLLNGVFDSDYGLEIIPEFDEASDSEKSEVLAMYVDSLKNTFELLDNELTNDSETWQTWDKYKYNVAVARGDIKVPEKLSHRKEKKLKKLLKRLKKAVHI